MNEWITSVYQKKGDKLRTTGWVIVTDTEIKLYKKKIFLFSTIQESVGSIPMRDVVRIGDCEFRGFTGVHITVKDGTEYDISMTKGQAEQTKQLVKTLLNNR